MADENVDLGNETVGGTKSAPPKDSPSGFDGIMNQTVHPETAHDPTAAEILSDKGAHNRAAPETPAVSGNVTIVDPSALQQAINIYNTEIANLRSKKQGLSALEQIEPPGNEFASQSFVQRNMLAVKSAIESYQSLIDAAQTRCDQLVAVLDQYNQTEQANVDSLKYKG